MVCLLLSLSTFNSMASEHEKSSTKPAPKAVESDESHNPNLIMGYFAFDSKVSESKVADYGRQILKLDKSFINLTVVATGPNEFGLYFKYTKRGSQFKTADDFAAFYDDKLGKLSGKHLAKHSIADDLILLKY